MLDFIKDNRNLAIRPIGSEELSTLGQKIGKQEWGKFTLEFLFSFTPVTNKKQGHILMKSHK